MRLVKIIFSVVVILSILGFVVLSYLFRPLSKEEANSVIEKRIEKFADKNNLDQTLVRLYSEKGDYDESYAAGSIDNLSTDDRYHSASIGKTFTSTLMYMLEEKKLLNMDDLIVDYLDKSLLEGLFVVDDKDYKDQVTIKMLLNHTSGAGDYFEDPVLKGSSFIEQMIKDPDKLYKPNDLLDFTRENQVAKFKPGHGFHYSDTAYILAGMIIESVTGHDFHQVLHDYIIDPLNLEDTNLTFKSKASSGREDMLPIFINGIDFSNKNALSIDWSGGGLTTTLDDLLDFNRALHGEKLISKHSLNEMKEFKNVYDKGIYYGVGMMSFKLEELSPMLKGMPDLYGGVGATASYMLYDESKDLFIVMNVGSYDMVEKSLAEIVQILMVYNRIDLDK